MRPRTRLSAGGSRWPKLPRARVPSEAALTGGGGRGRRERRVPPLGQVFSGEVSQGLERVKPFQPADVKGGYQQSTGLRSLAVHIAPLVGVDGRGGCDRRVKGLQPGLPPFVRANVPVGPNPTTRPCRQASPQPPACAARPPTVPGLAVTATATPPGSVPSGVVFS